MLNGAINFVGWKKKRQHRKSERKEKEGKKKLVGNGKREKVSRSQENPVKDRTFLVTFFFFPFYLSIWFP